MAFDHTIVAISWLDGRYSVIESGKFGSLSQIDWNALKRAHPWNDITGETQYLDHVMTLSPEQLSPFVCGDAARAFLDRTRQAGVFVYLLHRGEWESGIADT